MGTWTPIITASDVAPVGVVYNPNKGQVGWFGVSGDVVTLSGVIRLTSKGSSGAGSVKITGLPFPGGALDVSHVGAVIHGQLMIPPSVVQVSALLSGATDYITFSKSASGAFALGLNWNELTDKSALYFSIQYPKAP